MTDLTADVNDNQVYWKVSDMPVADYLQADDEIVRIIYRLAQHEEVYVERGYAGTTAASHSSGELTTLWVPGTGGSSGGVTLMGPYPIAFDTPGINGDTGDFLGAHLVALDPGLFIIRAYAFVTAIWDGEAILTLQIGNSSEQLALETLNITTSMTPVAEFWSEAVSAQVSVKAAIVGEDSDLIAYIPPNAATQGTADVYLLVAA